jgi:hypothetical protein
MCIQVYKYMYILQGSYHILVGNHEYYPRIRHDLWDILK